MPNSRLRTAIRRIACQIANEEGHHAVEILHATASRLTALSISPIGSKPSELALQSRRRAGKRRQPISRSASAAETMAARGSRDADSANFEGGLMGLCPEVQKMAGADSKGLFGGAPPRPNPIPILLHCARSPAINYPVPRIYSADVSGRCGKGSEGFTPPNQKVTGRRTAFRRCSKV